MCNTCGIEQVTDAQFRDELMLDISSDLCEICARGEMLCSVADSLSTDKTIALLMNEMQQLVNVNAALLETVYSLSGSVAELTKSVQDITNDYYDLKAADTELLARLDCSIRQMKMYIDNKNISTDERYAGIREAIENGGQLSFTNIHGTDGAKCPKCTQVDTPNPDCAKTDTLVEPTGLNKKERRS